jgi:hypothetical protein
VRVSEGRASDTAVALHGLAPHDPLITLEMARSTDLLMTQAVSWRLEAS